MRITPSLLLSCTWLILLFSCGSGGGGDGTGDDGICTPGTSGCLDVAAGEVAVDSVAVQPEVAEELAVPDVAAEDFQADGNGPNHEVISEVSVDTGPACGCADKMCGDDGCGASCGACEDGLVCDVAGYCGLDPELCNFNGFYVAAEEGKLEHSPDGFNLHYVAKSKEAWPHHELVLDIDSHEPFFGPEEAGEYDLAFSSFAKGGLWLYLLHSYDGQQYGKLFVPVSGTVDLQNLGLENGKFAAVLNAVVMAEAVVDPDTLEVTLVEGGKSWCVHGVILHSPLAVEQAGCVEEGTGQGIGEKIANFTLQECSGKEISLHDYCGEKKAVWFILVAGWCSACEQYIPQAHAIWQQYLSEGLQLVFILGENAAGQTPSLAYCNSWKKAHQLKSPVLVDSHWQVTDAHIASQGAALPWDYLLDGDNMRFVWESVVFTMPTLMGEITKLLDD